LVWVCLTILYHGLACAGRRFLVGMDPVTTAYHSPDLSLNLPCLAFTNLYHRDGGQGTDSHIDHKVAGWCRVITVENDGTQWHSVENRRHHQKWVTRWHSDLVGVEKKKEKKSDHGRIAFYEHGGKTGRAMIKYPLYKKNAQRKNTLVYPGLTTVSFDRIINLCRTTMF
jgi:hypothetical protein